MIKSLESLEARYGGRSLLFHWSEEDSYVVSRREGGGKMPPHRPTFRAKLGRLEIFRLLLPFSLYLSLSLPLFLDFRRVTINQSIETFWRRDELYKTFSFSDLIEIQRGSRRNFFLQVELRFLFTVFVSQQKKGRETRNKNCSIPRLFRSFDAITSNSNVIPVAFPCFFLLYSRPRPVRQTSRLNRVRKFSSIPRSSGEE